MEQNSLTLTECVAPLILQFGVPLKAVGAIGSIIEIDARLRDFGGGLLSGTSLDDLALNLERYDEVVQRARAAVQEFSQQSDGFGLIQRLIKIKDDLAFFSEASQDRPPTGIST